MGVKIYFKGDLQPKLCATQKGITYFYACSREPDPEVRAPIPQKHEVLVEEQRLYGLNSTSYLRDIYNKTL